jgi:acetone carboxylase gamma subunit
MIRDLVEGRLSDEDVLQLQREKDINRLEVVLSIEQERVPWDDRILVLLQEHLYVVDQVDHKKVVKCFCGYVFGDYRHNWKDASLVYERDPSDGTVYTGGRGADPAWQILREFYCPSCATMLDIEPIPVGYPFIFNFLPELDD